MKAELGNGPWEKDYKPSGINQMNECIDEMIKRRVAEQDRIIKDSFRKHFGYPITELKDTENLSRESIIPRTIQEFKYKGETFLLIDFSEGVDVQNKDGNYEAIMSIRYLYK
jgi:hypothetical protein